MALGPRGNRLSVQFSVGNLCAQKSQMSDVDYIAWQCDQDAYASIGQKCSAQSIMFMHENWKDTGLLEKMKANASKRSLEDFTNGPVITQTTKNILDHVDRLLRVPGASLVFGGKPLENHKIPEKHGAAEPTAVYVPLEQTIKDEYFGVCSTEILPPSRWLLGIATIHLI